MSRRQEIYLWYPGDKTSVTLLLNTVVMSAGKNALKDLDRNTDGFSPGHFVFFTSLSSKPLLHIGLTQVINHFHIFEFIII